MMGWALDGRHLLYASDSTGSMGLWAVRVAGGKPQGLSVLLRPNIGAVSLGVAASGALYVGATISDRDIMVASLDFSTGKVLSPPARPIRTFLGSNAARDWSPDGKSLAYTTDQRRTGGDRVLSVRSMETGDVRELRPSLSMLDRPRWAPDGGSFASHGTDSQGRQGIYRIDAQTGEVTAIAYGELGHPLMYPQWSPDGTRIYYIDVIGHAIVERDLGSGAVRELARLNGLVPMTVSISPDGRYFAARANLDAKSMAVLLFPTAGGAPRELLRVALSTAIRNGPAWLPDSRGVAILKMPDGDGIRGTPELWLVPIEGGTPRRMDLQMAAETNLMRVHPDGRRLAYVAGETKYEVLVLENFLPAGKAATR
jgi:Tol biopolymer transport system component